MNSSSPVVIEFWEGFDDRHAFEMSFRGYLGDVNVVTPDGFKHPVYFIDIARLGQNLKEDLESGSPFFAERNMIVLNEVTLENIEIAINKLWQTGYFNPYQSPLAKT